MEPVQTTDKATASADDLIVLILKSQPALMAYQNPGEAHGKSAAAFLAAMRQGLIEMYRQPHRP